MRENRFISRKLSLFSSVFITYLCTHASPLSVSNVSSLRSACGHYEDFYWRDPQQSSALAYSNTSNRNTEQTLWSPADQLMSSAPGHGPSRVSCAGVFLGTSCWASVVHVAWYIYTVTYDVSCGTVNHNSCIIMFPCGSVFFFLLLYMYSCSIVFFFLSWFYICIFCYAESEFYHLPSSCGCPVLDI